MTALEELRNALLIMLDAIAPYNSRGRNKLEELRDHIESMPHWPNSNPPISEDPDKRSTMPGDVS